jgi:tRNA (Thr-GGU) A37 N-methylase
MKRWERRAICEYIERSQEFAAREVFGGIVSELEPYSKGVSSQNGLVVDSLTNGLSGISDYSHLIVVWHIHREKKVRLKVRPRGRTDMPEVDIFVTHFPPRPNHIATSVVELVSISGSSLTVKGLDA